MIALATRIELAVYAQIILIYLFSQILARTSIRTTGRKLFVVILISLSVNNMLDIFGWMVNGGTSMATYYANWILNSMLISFNSMPVAAWLIYVDYHLFGDVEKLRKRAWIYFIPFCISIIMVLMNIKSGFIFTISSEDIYTRNLGIYTIVIQSFIMLVGMFIVSRKNKYLVDGRVLASVFWVTLMPIIGALLQALFFGLSILWPVFILAMLITFDLVEKENLMRDALTGLKTRGQFEERLAYKLKKNVPFCIVLMDVNYFKAINDNYGHNEGDKALITVANIMREKTKRQDSVYRYGGDEFVFLDESMAANSVSLLIENLDIGVKEYNRTSGKPYTISLSFGGVYVEKEHSGNISSILSEADERMYKDKRKRKGTVPV